VTRLVAFLGAVLLAGCACETSDEVAILRGPGLCPLATGDGPCPDPPLPVEGHLAACLLEGSACGGVECCNGVCDTVTGTCP
jgi:hypothetical protein